MVPRRNLVRRQSLAGHSARTYVEPKTPPFPDGSTVLRFLSFSVNALPPVLVHYNTLNFPVYELFTIQKGHVVALHLRGTKEPLQFIAGATFTHGGGFSCMAGSGHSFLTTYSWDVAHPLQAKQQQAPNGGTTYSPDTAVNLVTLELKSVSLDGISANRSISSITYAQANHLSVAGC